jgi:cellulose synthase/poly-beta-1,6-N-acetylglucosamine synthase-like glycosyltransferase
LSKKGERPTFVNIISALIAVVNGIWNVISSLYLFRNIYKITGVFFTRKFKKSNNYHKYAILVAARNEAAVIGNLVDSIRKQDYPSELIDIFVVADNCTDNTAEVARSYGAVCYERFDKKHCTKGYALQFLVENIRKDYGIENYEGYLIFDADNLLKHDYMSHMNNAFDAGEKIVTSYRNTKNFDDNWISASYGVHWLRTVRNEHRARSLFHFATRIQGTGFLFASELLKDGWNYTSLTEDRAFCADAVAKGYKISYNNEAEFFDEQPVDMKMVMRQRIRWAKGHLQAFAETGPQLFSHIFVTGGMANKTYDGKSIDKPLWKKIYDNIRLRFMSFDMLTVVFPNSLVSSIRKVILYILRVILIVKTGKVFGVGAAGYIVRFKINGVVNWAIDWKDIFNCLDINPSYESALNAALWLAFFMFTWTITSYVSGIITAAYIYIVEHKRIKKIKLHRKIWFCLTFPIFDIIGRLSMIIAMFRKVEWEPILHNKSINIDEIECGGESADTSKKESNINV